MVMSNDVPKSLADIDPVEGQRMYVGAVGNGISTSPTVVLADEAGEVRA